MKKKYAMEWAKALESGKYRQGNGELYFDGKYCCLGVLCKINGVNMPTGSIMSDYPKVMKLVSFKTGDGELPKSEGITLVGLNDSGDYSFKKIAKVIRKYWRYL